MQMDEGHYDTPWEFKNRAIAAALQTANRAAAALRHNDSPLALLKCGATRNGTISGVSASHFWRSHNAPISGTVVEGPNVRQRVSASNFFGGPETVAAMMASSAAIPSTSSASGTSSSALAECPRRRFSTNSSTFDIKQQQKQHLVDQQQAHLPSMNRSEYRHPALADDDAERRRGSIKTRLTAKQPPCYSNALASSSPSSVTLFERQQQQQRRRARPNGTPLSTPSSSASTSSSVSSANSSAARRRSAAIAERRHEHYPLVGTSVAAAADWQKTAASESPLSSGGTASSAASSTHGTARHFLGGCKHHHYQQQSNNNPNGREMNGKNNKNINNNRICQCSLGTADNHIVPPIAAGNRAIAGNNRGSATTRSYENGTTCHKDDATTKSVNNPSSRLTAESSRISCRLIHVGLERAAAERALLEAGQVGDFLLRQRSVDDDANLALSLRAGDGVLHIKLERHDHDDHLPPPEFRDGDENTVECDRPTWVLGEGPRFVSISSMLKCYRRMELPVRGAEHVRLRTAFTVDDLVAMSG